MFPTEEELEVILDVAEVLLGVTAFVLGPFAVAFLAAYAAARAEHERRGKP